MCIVMIDKKNKANTNPEVLDEEGLFVKLFMEPMAHDLADRKPSSALESPKQNYERTLNSLKASFNEYKGYLANAGHLLDEAGFTYSHLEEMKQSVEASDDLPLPSSVKTYEDVLNITPQQLIQITDDELDQIYKIGCRHFENENYVGARDLFLLSITLNPKQYAAWLGLGIVEQQQGHHDMAMMAFSQALEANPESPAIYLYIAQSLQQMERASDALDLLNALIETCGDDEAYKEIKARAEKLKEECKRNVRQTNSEK